MSDSKRRKTAAQNHVKLGYSSSKYILNYNRKSSGHQSATKLDDVEPLIKHSEPGQLKELSSKDIKEDDVAQSLFAHVVVRECEQLIEKYDKTGTGDGVTTQRDIVRLQRRADDFVLASRDTADCSHRMRLWAARCRLILLLERMQMHEGTDTETATHNEHHDSMHLASEFVTNEMLAKWMADNEIGDSSVVRENPATGHWEHAIGSCGLSALWTTIRSLRKRWPFLALSPCLYVIIDRLRSRVAFFTMYRELLNEQTEKERSQKSVKIIGLSRSAWKAADPEWVIGSKYRSESQTAAKSTSHELSLLNSHELTRIVGEKKPGAQRFVTINDDMIEESERVLNDMLRQVRQCAGFKWHEDCASTKTECLACKLFLENSADIKAAKTELETIVTRETTANMRDNLQNDFRVHIWDQLLQPGEKELFATYRPLDSQKAQSVISRGRPDDGKNINRRCCSRKIADVWQDFIQREEEKATGRGGDDDDGDGTVRDEILIDYAEKSDPTYAVLVRLAIGYHLDSLSSGGRFALYTIDCHTSNEPFLFKDERFKKSRVCLTEFHTHNVTTGTLKWRYKYESRVGLDAPQDSQEYQHPLILKTMASFCVLYKERMHMCNDFSDAFLLWIAIMCEDSAIGGETSTEFSLFSLYERLFAKRSTRISTLKAQVEKRKDDWDAYSKLFPKSAMVEKQTSYDTNSTLQY